MRDGTTTETTDTEAATTDESGTAVRSEGITDSQVEEWENWGDPQDPVTWPAVLRKQEWEISRRMAAERTVKLLRAKNTRMERTIEEQDRSIAHWVAKVQVMGCVIEGLRGERDG